MASINKAIIVGRLGQDPEVRQFQNGGSLTSINVATSDRWTDKNTGEQKEQTEWHRVSLFNRLGEIAAQYLRKGSLVYIEGSLHTRKYTDAQGIERYSTEIRANQMQMLDRREGGQGQDWQGGGYGNRQNNTNTYNQPGQWGGHDGHQNHHGGGFGGGQFQGGNFNNQFHSNQNGFGQGMPSYQNNNPNQGFGQQGGMPNQGMGGMEQSMGQGMNVPASNPFMNDKPVPTKAVTPPVDTKPTDEDLPF